MAGFAGMRLGAYELLERIGEGGMAEVYRAKQLTAFGREVAIKVMRPEFTGDSPFRRRFLREALAVSRLSHPHILPLIEFGDEDGLLYLVMPLVREGTLRDLLNERGGWLAMEEAVQLFAQLCDAVQYAHTADIIHRDIKPQNILLQQHTHVLLADFGIARDRFDTHMTQTGAGVGTAEYMAPEQAEGQADARSDIYSMGVVLYQMLTGALPYPGTTPLQIVLRHANETAPDPRQHNPSLPVEIADVLQIALAKDPDQRFASAQAFNNALQQIRLTAVSQPFPGHSLGVPFPGAPTHLDTDALPTQDARATRPYAEPEAAEQQQGFGSLLTDPATSDALPARHAARHQSAHSADTIITPSAWEASTSGDSDWGSLPTWSGQHEAIAAAGAESDPPRRRRRGLMVAALVIALVAMLAISSIAYSYFDLGWLQPGSPSNGAQPVAGATGAAAQPPNTPAPGAPASPQPPIIINPPPGSTATPQPTASATPQPTATATPQPTATPAPAPLPTNTPGPPPTATPAPPPTATPAPQPTALPTPGPTDTPTVGSTATATPAPATTPTPPASTTPTSTPTP